MPSLAVRHDSELLAYLPEDTVTLFRRYPNLGSTLTEAERLFKARLQESPVLRAPGGMSRRKGRRWRR